MEPAPLWLEFLKLVGAGLTGAIATQVLAWWREARRERALTMRDARYLALRLSIILEHFAISCANVIEKNKLHWDTEGHLGSKHNIIPALPDLPNDADWKALDPELASRALAVPNELRLAAQSLSFTADVSDDEDVIYHFDEQTGLHGGRALELAKDLRRVYSLPSFDVAHHLASVLNDGSVSARAKRHKARATKIA